MTSLSQANFSTTEHYSPIHIYIPHPTPTQTDAGKINWTCKKSFMRFKHKFQNHIPVSLLNYLPNTVPLFSYLWDSTLTGYNLQNPKPFIVFILKRILVNKYKLLVKAWSQEYHTWPETLCGKVTKTYHTQVCQVVSIFQTGEAERNRQDSRIVKTT